VTLTGVVYVPDAQVSITGNGNVTINDGPGRATLPPILGALIAYDLKVDGNGDLTINPDNDPPGGAAALPQNSLLLSGGQQADGNSPSSAPVPGSGASTTGANQRAVDQLFSSNSGGTGAALSGESKGEHFDRSLATRADPLSGQVVDELVSSLVQVA